MREPIDVEDLEREVQRKPMALTLLTYGLQALSNRALVWVAALGGGGLWALAVMQPEPLRITAALGYSVSILAPILWRDAKG